jgi:iron complex outermembrane recepter protein
MKTRLFKNKWLVFLILPTSIFAQNSIKGNISNQNGELLPGASVFIEENFYGTASNLDGRYQISNVKTGEYTLVVRFVGYKTQKKEITILYDDLNIDFILEENNILADEYIVKATRADSKTPVTSSNLDKEAISKSNYGQDLPFILDQTPATVVTSDAGAGVGYTGIRIRGVDPTRTNVTVNGIPLNDSESHGVFWVNMPDFASSVESIQVQRGVGTSSNGAAAFGASINVLTNTLNEKPYAEINNTFGSFNTMKNTVNVGTGLIDNKFTLDARLSKITSDGYIDRAAADLKSFYLAGAWYGKKSSIKANIMSGKEITYQSWYGTPESVLSGNEDEMNAYADRNYLSDGERENLLSSGRTYNFYEYENEVDNYQQDHYQLHFTHQFNKNLYLTTSGHYTKGRGYYEQFRKDDDFADYELEPIAIDCTVISNTDLIRRRWLDNDFYGGVFSLNYDNQKNLNIIFGGSANKYDGAHFGEVIWARYASQSNLNHRYYDNDAVKIEYSSYIKTLYTYQKFQFFGDLQFRYIDYQFLGVDDVSGTIQNVSQKVSYEFFNPKVGLNYELNKNNLFYASYAVAHREPVRDDFRENTPENRPKPEQLQNIEMGHRFKKGNFILNTNTYLMYYKDQLVLTGQINDVGGYTRTNVDESYRAGLEIEGGYKFSKKFTLTGNIALSMNKIPEFKEYIFDWAAFEEIEITYQNTDLAFSPNFIGGLNLTYVPIKNLEVSLLPKYVSKQYLDNTSSEDRMIDAYFISHFRVSYTLENKIGKALSFGLLVNNIFNEMYQNNGYTWGYLVGGERTNENFYYPQAGRNFLLNVNLKF